MALPDHPLAVFDVFLKKVNLYRRAVGETHHDFEKKMTKKRLKTKTEKSFRLRGKKLFLTYSQCGLPLPSVLTQLQDLLATYGVENYLLVTEDHDDRSVNIGVHIHVFLTCRKRVDIKNPLRLDLKDDDEKVYHGNYQTCKNDVKTIEYCLKDVVDMATVLVSKNLALRISKEGLFMPVDQSIIKLAKEGRIAEALDVLERERPKAYMKSRSAYEKSFRDISMVSRGAIKRFDMSQYILPVGLEESLKAAIEGRKTIYLTGPSGTGKSQFIKTFLDDQGFRPLIINNVDSLSKFKENLYDSIVFDDCDISQLSKEKLIKLVDSDEQTTLEVRYMNVELPEGTPRILIHNKKLSEVLNKKIYPDKAIDRRIEVFEINRSLVPSIKLEDKTSTLS